MELARSGWLLLGFLIASSARTEASQRTGIAPERASSPEELELLVVDRSGNPLSGAEVRYAVEDERSGVIQDESAPGGSRQALYLQTPPHWSSVDRLLERRPVMSSSSAGKVRLGCPPGRGLLASGRHGDLWGFLWLPRDWRETEGPLHPQDQPLRLELAPDWSLTVAVLDDRGRTAGNVSVRLRCTQPFLSLGATGAAGSGQLLFEHLGYELKDAVEPVIVSVDAPLHPPVEATVDPRHPPQEPVILRLPPTGSVGVRLLGPDGRPADRSVELRFVEDPVPHSRRRFDDREERYFPRFTRAGQVEFETVSLGREIEVSVAGAPSSSRVRVHGPSAAGEKVEVTLTLAPEEAPVPGPLTAGSKPPPRGSLQGLVLLDAWVPPQGVAIELHSLATPCTTGAEIRGGGFAFVGVPVGRARLEVFPSATRTLGSNRPLLFSAELEVAPGENQDPRLASIDLRGKLFAHRIRLTGLDRGRRFHARVHFGPARRFLPLPCYHHARELPVVLVSPWESLDVELFAPGYRSVSLRDFRDSAEIQLEPGIQVRLRLDTDGALPEPPRYLKAVLVPVENTWIGFDWEGPAFGASREVSTFAWRPGCMKVTWIAAHHERREDGSRSGGGTVYEVMPPQYVYVLDSQREQTFEVQISARELARMFRESD